MCATAWACASLLRGHGLPRMAAMVQHPDACDLVRLVHYPLV